jgi:hypothetical protein
MKILKAKEYRRRPRVSFPSKPRLDQTQWPGGSRSTRDQSGNLIAFSSRFSQSITECGGALDPKRGRWPVTSAGPSADPAWLSQIFLLQHQAPTRSRAAEALEVEIKVRVFY